MCRGRERSPSPHRRGRTSSRRHSRSRSRTRSRERRTRPNFLDMEYGEYRKNFREVSLCHLRRCSHIAGFLFLAVLICTCQADIACLATLQETAHLIRVHVITPPMHAGSRLLGIVQCASAVFDLICLCSRKHTCRHQTTADSHKW